MATQLNIHEAKTHSSQLIERACAGEEVIIAKAGKSMVRLVPVEQTPTGRSFSALRGRANVDDAFFDPLPKDELKAWE
ncbi:type II toxin-antitoxin system prevent-host-death family antitoxin [Thiohalocapsa halophila]|uniref:Antitoxin n=1 Tax=Thiohalocapsa halophila TaxID=69359 RepID=A0ABS1CPP5_9GAMM|nr:type II toxin-antitoxin system Phd/YefM family antitoxin [Thiohalocapsa halophila]MBK1633459.1 type II toxin-antitoxin system prevent-host-death family antitoxin [Thiohalocapsa halophila]